MIEIQSKIPRNVVIACSGGVDSMAIVDFLKRNHTVTLQFVHHRTETSEKAHDFLKSYSYDNNLTLLVDYINPTVPKNVSQEEHWRNERYSVLHNLSSTVITAHHLDDCVETWIWTSMHGEGRVIPYRNQNVIRPFRMNRKSEFYSWCNRHSVPFIEDESNSDTRYMRNYIRHEMMPHVLKLNSGIHTVIRKKIKQECVEATVECN